jgi:hypothetical protein
MNDEFALDAQNALSQLQESGRTLAECNNLTRKYVFAFLTGDFALLESQPRGA